MGKHGHRDRGYRDSFGHRDDRDSRMAGGPVDYDARPRLPRKLPTAVVLVGLVLWSLLAWVGYVLVDPILGWVASSAGLLVDGGKDIATATGSKEVGAILDNLNVSGFMGQTIALLRVVLKPAVVAVWAIGAVVLLAAPLILSKIGRLFAGHRH
ncbi:hypothetical protein BN1110_06349 [bacterium YEK0313]|nr:hypothetical protein BN1110_06349 [bacterium YEK0313]